MNDGRENRRSFRILESVHLICETISDREFHEGLERRKIRRGVNEGLRSMILDLDARLTERLYVLQAESRAAAECIGLLNEKLSAVIEQLPVMRKSKTALAERQPQLCELGADGMLFGTEAPIATGTRLALRLLLMPGNRYIETFCTVTRQIPPPDGEDERYPCGVAVEFLGMPSSQKEIIIQHLFNREAESLRTRRLNMKTPDASDELEDLQMP